MRLGLEQLGQLVRIVQPLAQRVVGLEPALQLFDLLDHLLARSWSLHTPPSAMVCSSSARRAVLASTSKKAPKLLQPAVELGRNGR